MEKINEAMVREIVKKVLAEMMTAEDFVKEKDASGILKVKTDTVRCEPFSDMVISGVLEIEIDGRIVTGYPGDIIYIPKGSHIHFQTPSKARYVYFVYPADWQNEA